MKNVVASLLFSMLPLIDSSAQDTTKHAPVFTVVQANADSAPDVGIELTVTDEKGNPIPSAQVIIKRDGGATVVELTTDQDGKFKMQETAARRFFIHNSAYLLEVKSSPGNYLGSYMVMNTYGISVDTLMHVSVQVITEACHIYEDGIQFPDKAVTIDSTGQENLGSAYMFANANPTLDIDIITVYDKKSEGKLALKRVLAVQQQLVDWGIDASRLSVQVYQRTEATDDCGKKIHGLAPGEIRFLILEL